MHTFPNWQDLMTTWLAAHHKGEPCVIFSRPLQADGDDYMVRVNEMKRRFKDLYVEVINAEFAVFVCSSVAEGNQILRETPEGNPYTLLWDGHKLVSHH